MHEKTTHVPPVSFSQLGTLGDGGSVGEGEGGGELTLGEGGEGIGDEADGGEGSGGKAGGEHGTTMSGP